jgi:hypothetical protein
VTKYAESKDFVQEVQCGAFDSRKLRDETLDNPSDIARHLREDWNDSLVLGTTDLLERYRAKKLGIHVHFQIIQQAEVTKFCAVLQYAAGEQIHEVGVLAISEEHAQMVPRDETAWNQSVLVGVIEVMQHPEGVLVCGTPIVGLITLDKCSGAPGNALYHGRCSGYKFVPLLKDRELPPFLSCLIRKKVDDVIESGPQLMCDFTSEQHQVDWWRLAVADLNSVQTHYTRLEIRLGPHCVIPHLIRGSVLAELVDVLYGPFNLGPCSI